MSEIRNKHMTYRSECGCYQGKRRELP